MGRNMESPGEDDYVGGVIVQMGVVIFKNDTIGAVSLTMYKSRSSPKSFIGWFILPMLVIRWFSLARATCTRPGKLFR